VPVATLLFKWGDTLCQYLHHLPGKKTHGSRIYIAVKWVNTLCQYLYCSSIELTSCAIIYIAYPVRWHLVPESTLLIIWGDTWCMYLHCLSSEVTLCASIYSAYQARWYLVIVSILLIKWADMLCQYIYTQWGDTYYSTVRSCNRRTVLFSWDWTLLRAITITKLNFTTFTIKCLFPSIFIQI